MALILQLPSVPLGPTPGLQLVTIWVSLLAPTRTISRAVTWVHSCPHIFLGAPYLFGLPLILIFLELFFFTLVILCVWTHNTCIEVGELHAGVDSLLLCRFKVLNSGHPVCVLYFNSQAILQTLSQLPNPVTYLQAASGHRSLLR